MLNGSAVDMVARRRGRCSNGHAGHEDGLQCLEFLGVLSLKRRRGIRNGLAIALLNTRVESWLPCWKQKWSALSRGHLSAWSSGLEGLHRGFSILCIEWKLGKVKEEL